MAAAALTGQAGNIICMRRPEWAASGEQAPRWYASEALNPVRAVRKPDRRITLNAGIIADTIGQDGRLHRDRQQAASALLKAQGDPVTLMDFAIPIDGEVCVALTICAALLDHSGNAEIEGIMRLYRGPDRADRLQSSGERRFEFYCPAGRSVTQFIRVPDGDDGEDRAVLQLTISNSAG